MGAIRMAEIKRSEEIDFSPLRPTAIESTEFIRTSTEIIKSLTNVIEIRETLKEIDLNAADYQEKNDILLTALHRFHTAISSPDFSAWIRIGEIISTALKDPIITKSNQSVNFLTLILKLTEKSFFGQAGPAMAIGAIESEILSNRGRVIAKQKNKKARDWVISEWESRQDTGQSKAAFSRQYVHLVKTKFGVIIIPDTISRNWLPSEKNPSA